MKETLKTANVLLKKRCMSINITSITERDNHVHEKREISNTMNDYFCAIGQELADEID